jgi:hypothetical protein
LLYWTTRIALVVAWLLVARRALGRRHAWPGLAFAFAAAAVLFASLRAVTWNYAALEAARGALRSAGMYGQRGWWKLVLAAGLLVAGTAFWCRVRRAAPDRRAVLCAAAVLLQGTLIGIETFSLDDVLPRAFTDQPGRYLAEGSFAALALWALRPAEADR